MTIAVESETRRLVKKYGFRFKKSLGQNFLVDEQVLQAIVNAAQLTPGDVVVEIGPGLGTLTRRLAQQAGRVIAVEVDRNLEPVLRETLAGLDNVEVHWGDVLKTDLDALVSDKTEQEFGRGGKSYKVVANLPYYITTPIVMRLLEEGYNLESLVIMVQQEVAARLVAAPGTRDCGAISVAVHYHTIPELVTRVSRKAFVPPPEVESGVVRLTRRTEPPVLVGSEHLFFRVVKAAFAQRRKTLLNALANSGFSLDKSGWAELLESLGIDQNRRGETLAIEEFALLSSKLWERGLGR
ncbi:MAG TPA: 16S rRNA (adenine(1518)-N(6)/adenine(1519)-N(6))-dimethyltransferase RsmA [Bacillota bacterium]|nr:16S rRNA (adenine(1518)-N(6)/adenine(1519)-N(6))-dimethyltransferase RsmA [Bacillota bacterium]